MQIRSLFLPTLAAAALSASCLHAQTAQTAQAAQPASAAMAASADQAPVAVKYRKNIDDLTPEELAAYEHAVQRMKEKSQANIYDRTGFLWQAWVHNCVNVKVTQDRKLAIADGKDFPESCNLSGILPPQAALHTEFPGMCEHRKDEFLLWHRAEFYFYEKALQDADPEGKYGPSTKNVMVPYWNFTKKPSGVRFPKVYEDPNSPLYAKGRASGAPDPMPPYTSPYLLAYQIYYLDWQDFGGYPVGGAGNAGQFEYQIHDDMHDEYVNGYMQSPTTAGLDPLFYAFHAYLDYILEKWMEEHGAQSITGARAYMRSEQDDSLPKPPGFDEGTGNKRGDGDYTKNMGRAGLYFDTKKLGYAYQPGPGGEFLPKSAIEPVVAEYERPDAPVFGSQPRSLRSVLMSFERAMAQTKPQAVVSGKVVLPQPGVQGAQAPKGQMLVIRRQPGSADYSFDAAVYLHPQNVKANLDDQAFRERYLLTRVSYWGMSGHHDHAGGASAMLPTVLYENVDKVVGNLAAHGQGGQTWVLTAGVASHDAKEALRFDAPEIEAR